MKIAECIDVKKSFPIHKGYLRKKSGVIKAVDGVSLEIEKGETFGLVGESGSGKTTLGKILLGIIKPDSGSIEVATNKMQVIFQDPHNSLDPKMKVFGIISEGLMLRSKEEPPSLRGREAPEAISKNGLLRHLRCLAMTKIRFNLKKRVEEILDLVNLPKSALDKYPHQFSGGERQRIAIARAVVTEPEFIVCDEPVSSLDVTIQLQILNLLKDIRRRFSITYLFISHDLRVVKFMCGQVAVMKEGKIVEKGPTRKIYKDPVHPYTKLLLSSVLS